MLEIRDPVHGYVRLDPLATELLDTPQVQRLRWIKQLGLANLVYPGASHTRFEHSLGTCHLAGVMADHLGLDPDDRSKIGAAALLHDIGHGPLSHATEIVFSDYLRVEHERVIDLLRKTELRDILEGHGIEPRVVQQLITGSTELGHIISGEIDVDRMDYLIRDAHYTGVAYGVIDQLRLIGEMKIHLGRLVVAAGGIQAAESLLVSRLLMYPTVYFHHVCRISEAMVASGIRYMIEERGVSPSEIKGLDDVELFSLMASFEGYPAEIIDRIKSRRLFKRAVYVGIGSLENAGQIAGIGGQRMAKEIADEAGVDPRYVLVDNPVFPEVPEGNFPAMAYGDILPLREVSPLVAILERAHRATWRLGVYSREEDRDRVKTAAKRCLNIKKGAVQHTFDDMASPSSNV